MNRTCRIEKKFALTLMPTAADMPIRTDNVWAFAGARKTLRLPISDGTKPKLAIFKQSFLPSP